MTIYHIVEANPAESPKYNFIQSGTVPELEARLKEDGFTFHYLNTAGTIYARNGVHRGLITDKQLDLYIKNKSVTRFTQLTDAIGGMRGDCDLQLPFFWIHSDNKSYNMDSNVARLYESFQILRRAYGMYLDEEPIGWKLSKDNLREIYSEAMQSYEGERLLEHIVSQVWVANIKAKANKEAHEASKVVKHATEPQVTTRKKPWWHI